MYIVPCGVSQDVCTNIFMFDPFISDSATLEGLHRRTIYELPGQE